MTPTLFLGKTTEYLVLSRLLKEQREAYLPAVGDHGVDVIVRTRHKGEDEGLSAVASYEFASEEERAACLAEEFQEIQIKSAASNGLFAAMKITPAPTTGSCSTSKATTRCGSSTPWTWCGWAAKTRRRARTPGCIRCRLPQARRYVRCSPGTWWRTFPSCPDPGMIIEWTKK